MPRGHPKPDIIQAMRWARDDIQSWSQRDARFKREQSMLFLQKPYTPKIGEDVVVPSDLAFITEKATRILASLPERVRVPPRDPSNQERAQKIENLAKNLWRQWQRQHSEGIRLPLRYEEAKFLIQRGWVCTRLTLNPDDKSEEPTVFTMYDPATVFPYEVGNRLVRVTHRYRATASDLIDDPNLPKAEAELSESPSAIGSYKWVYSQYVEWNGVFYHQVWMSNGGEGAGSDGRWLKPPTPIDYMPWVISIAVGTPFKATEWDMSGYIERIGESFITNMVDMHKQSAKIMTMLSTIIATMANPPTALFLEDGGRVTANEISMKPGARMVFPKARIEQYRIGSGLSDLMAYYQMIEDRQQKASFATASYGDPRGIESGYMGETMQAGNRDILYPYVAALEGHHRKLYEKAFMLIGKFWPKNVPVFIKKGVNRPEGWGEITQADLRIEDPMIDVSMPVMSSQERIQKSAMATQLAAQHLISHNTARGEAYLDLEDPELEEMEVQADLIKLDPDMIKAQIPLALAFMGMNMESKLYGAIHGGEIMRLLQQGSAASQQQQGPAQGQGQPLPQGMPSMEQSPGGAPMDGAVTPPIALAGQPPGVMSGQDEMLRALLARLQGAVGGAGGGGVPPQPGGFRL